MGQIRECTVCARRMYSTAEKNCPCDRTHKTCRGLMRLIELKERPRYRYRMDGTKMGEFW